MVGHLVIPLRERAPVPHPPTGKRTELFIRKRTKAAEFARKVFEIAFIVTAVKQLAGRSNMIALPGITSSSSTTGDFRTGGVRK
jgi:hypothetical protein